MEIFYKWFIWDAVRRPSSGRGKGGGARSQIEACLLLPAHFPGGKMKDSVNSNDHTCMYGKVYLGDGGESDRPPHPKTWNMVEHMTMGAF